MLRTEPAWISALRHSLIRLDGFMAGLSLLMLMALVLGQVLLRNFMDSGIPNADILSRYLVLYITFFGAALAIERHRHIRIDIVAAFLTPARLRRITPLLYLLSSAVCAVMAWAAMRFWYDDWEYVAAHERWSSILALITPFGFCLLTVHFLLGGLYLPPLDERR
ncbi:MAG TPA: TRAP transporter small permease subunit [Gammaproteobacteria bacterium]|nr:TRAP transporter small permease subunit [Gammaproteobacteria bacterium]